MLPLYDQRQVSRPVGVIALFPGMCGWSSSVGTGVASAKAPSRLAELSQKNGASVRRVWQRLAQHLAGAMFESAAGNEIRCTCPGKGGAPALNDGLLNDDAGKSRPPRCNTQAGNQPLAVTSARRSPILPAVPTMRGGRCWLRGVRRVECAVRPGWHFRGDHRLAPWRCKRHFDAAEVKARHRPARRRKPDRKGQTAAQQFVRQLADHTLGQARSIERGAFPSTDCPKAQNFMIRKLPKLLPWQAFPLTATGQRWPIGQSAL